jgi:hypothetical protein
MSNKKRLELNESEKSLLLFSAGDLIPMLQGNKELVHVKQGAYDYYDSASKETFQVQVTVTRRTDDFLEPFQTEEMKMYNPITP